jgi:hypothetical protein
VTPKQRATIADLADELDATRKAALDEVAGLTVTEIYNLRQTLRSGEPLSFVDADRARAARAGIVDRLHDQIDAAVADAYGWPADLAPAEIWLRPDYQRPRFEAR